MPPPTFDEETAKKDSNTSSILNDIAESIYEVRYSAPIFSLIILVVATASVTDFNHVMANFGITTITRPNNISSLASIRPVLSDSEMAAIQRITMYSETSFKLPPPYYDTIKLRFHTSATSHGHFAPPELFYEGVVFGLGCRNNHNLQYGLSDEEEVGCVAELTEALHNMYIKPTAVMDRVSQHNESKWSDEGVAVHFALSDLKHQGMLSSDKIYPWKRARDEVLKVARQFKQVYIYEWFPHLFGDATQNENHQLESIIQSVVPTRTGLGPIKSTAAVWMSAKNGTEMTKPKLLAIQRQRN